MKPIPWSHSSLEDFVNCPRSYHAKRIAKTVKQVQGEEAKWGEYVHKQFEDRQGTQVPLPPELVEHEPFMLKLEAMPGNFFTEQKIALDRKLVPCSFFSTGVWFRGIVDYTKIFEGAADIYDYKSGKPHDKWVQLALCAIHTFIMHPEVQLVRAHYYWTKTMSVTNRVYLRDDMEAMWNLVIPNLKQYAEAFKTDTWQPRKSGLCNGWCPVTSCENWKPKRVR